MGQESFCPLSALAELFTKGGEEGGPPRFGFGVGAGARGGVFNGRCQDRESQGKPGVELLGGGDVGEGGIPQSWSLSAK